MKFLFIFELPPRTTSAVRVVASSCATVCMTLRTLSKSGTDVKYEIETSSCVNCVISKIIAQSTLFLSLFRLKTRPLLVASSMQLMREHGVVQIGQIRRQEFICV